MASEKPRVRWQDLSGEERYRVIEMMRQGDVEIRELCKSFGVSRQTLYRAREAADRASIEALTKKRPGRKSPPASETEMKDLQRQKKRLEKDLHRMSQRYEIAQTLLDLQRAPEKKTPRTTGGYDPQDLFTHRRSAGMAPNDGSGGAGDRSGVAGSLGAAAEEDGEA